MSDKHECEKTPWLELAISGIGALLVLLTVGYLLYEAFGSGETAPADIVLEKGRSTEQSVGWRVPVNVRNLGDQPAKAIELRAELRRANAETEEAALTLDFLPPHGTVEVVFLFKQDPGIGKLSLQAVSYLSP